ncbi:MAG: PQQ-dependent sugar dehydrogenase [Bacteroidota bacterium]
MIKKVHLLFAVFFPVLLCAQAIGLLPFANGFTRPIDIQHANDSRLFIVEQDGVIKILDPQGNTNAIPFLDIDARVRSTGNEQGLLGLAFDPNYTTNNRFYVNYINNSGDTVIARFTTSSNPDIADPNSEEILLTISQPYINHNGGAMAFGNDGYLYIALGDGGSAGDPQNYSQNLQSLLGKILRIDVSGASGYSVPATNPFVSDANVLDEIWAYGLRNPWKISFDSDNGDLWIGDVGQSNREEINHVPIANVGYNFGWRCYEGNEIFNTSGCSTAATTTFPAQDYVYGGNPFRCSVTGGYRYRGNLYPNIQGWYIFADYCSDELGGLRPGLGNTWDLFWYDISSSASYISTFGEDQNKEMYAAGLLDGTIYQVYDPTLSVDENSQETQYQLYPNPAKDYFQINNQNAASGIKEVILYSLGGTVISNVVIRTENQPISTAQLAKGVYVVEIISENDAVSYHKLVKN